MNGIAVHTIYASSTGRNFVNIFRFVAQKSVTFLCASNSTNRQHINAPTAEYTHIIIYCEHVSEMEHRLIWTYIIIAFTVDWLIRGIHFSKKLNKNIKSESPIRLMTIILSLNCIYIRNTNWLLKLVWNWTENNSTFRFFMFNFMPIANFANGEFTDVGHHMRSMTLHLCKV